MPRASSGASRRIVWIDGVEYVVNREALVRDGGSTGTSDHPWYLSVIDPGGRGNTIDGRVPEGYFRTVHEAREALRAHVARRAEARAAGSTAGSTGSAP